MKFLIAIDDSEASQKAVAFAGRVLGQRAGGDVAITLMHVIESLPEFLFRRGTRDAEGSTLRQVADEWAETGRALGEELLRAQKAALLKAGIPDAAISTRLVEREGRPEARRVVASLAIIEEMRRGNYDVVVLGRRSTSAIIETLIGSVAEKVAREAHGRTVWIVD